MISNPAMMANGAQVRPSSPALVGLAWLVVLVPLAWGVYNTLKTSVNLFTNSPAPAAVAAPASPVVVHAPGPASAPAGGMK